MSVSVRTRFEVFKRDRFTCSYCGRTPPEVLLEADHIVPKAAGGNDDMANLTTACATCNRGKAARLLEEGTAPVVGRATLEELAERVEQAKAYMELLGATSAVVSNQVGMVIDHWAKLFGATSKEEADAHYWVFVGGYGEMWPKEASLRRFLRNLTLEDVLKAAEIACERMNGEPGTNATRYFYGICNRAIKEGRPIGFRRNEPGETPDEAFNRGYQFGEQMENHRIRRFLSDHIENGYDTLLDAALALWGDDE